MIFNNSNLKLGRFIGNKRGFGFVDVDGEQEDIYIPNTNVNNAINWYTTSCLARKASGTDVTSKDSFAGDCNLIQDGQAYTTYAVGGVINAEDNVDVYDGSDYNGYQASISATPTDGKLYAFPYFTDTMKNITGTERPEFMTLAPNSIT